MASRTCASISRACRAPVSSRKRSASVDLPWSMCAMIEKLRIFRWSIRWNCRQRSDTYTTRASAAEAVVSGVGRARTSRSPLERRQQRRRRVRQVPTGRRPHDDRRGRARQTSSTCTVCMPPVDLTIRLPSRHAAHRSRFRRSGSRTNAGGRDRRPPPRTRRSELTHGRRPSAGRMLARCSRQRCPAVAASTRVLQHRWSAGAIDSVLHLRDRSALREARPSCWIAEGAGSATVVRRPPVQRFRLSGRIHRRRCRSRPPIQADRNERKERSDVQRRSS